MLTLQRQRKEMFRCSCYNNRWLSTHRTIAITLQNVAIKIEQTCPPLSSPFNINNNSLNSLMGTVIPNASLHIPGSKINSSGALLITHWGISGPSTLKLSSYAARIAKEQNYKIPIAINWAKSFSIAEVEKLLKDTIQNNPQKQISSIRFLDITNRVWTFLYHVQT